MNNEKISTNDILIFGEKIVQCLGFEFHYGIRVQDIHCKIELIHISLIQRKANKDEIKWFCENTENSKFIPPKVSVR
jgi:hypothetical protein